MVETYSTEGYTFQWKGGMYIDIFVEGGEYPFDVINVLDQSDNMTIHNRHEFIGECEAWLSDETDDYSEPDDVWDDEYDSDDSDFYVDGYSEDLADEWR